MRAFAKRLKRALALILAVAIMASYSAYALLRPLPALQPTLALHFSHPAKAVDLAWPDYGSSAVGAIGYGVLASSGDTQPKPTASVIKVLTALAVLKQKPLLANETGPILTLTQDDLDSYNHYVSVNGSVVQVAVGEQISERQALEALLLPSANNIAETLARWAFGSIDGYTAFANSYARELGMDDTTVTDPSGYSPTTVSTPHDLVVLGQAALENDVVSQIVSEPQATIPLQGTIYNTNHVLGESGVVGIKTGNTDQNPGCFLFAAKQPVGSQAVTVVGAIMDGPSLRTTMTDALPLIASVVHGFSAVDVADKGTDVARYVMPWRSPVYAKTTAGLTLTAWDGSTVDALADLRSVPLPTAAGTIVGTLTVDTKNVLPLALSEAASPPSPLWRLTHPFAR